MKKIFYSSMILLSFTSQKCLAQQMPISVTPASFNQDIVANGTGSNSFAVTSIAIDSPVFNNVLYSKEFQMANSGVITGGGLPTNGTLINGSNTYQLQNYNSNNAVFFAPSTLVTSRDITLLVPAAYTQLSIAAFAANGTSTMTVTTHYSDGTSETVDNPIVGDWYNGTPFIIDSLGRIDRSNTITGFSGLPDNPRIYPVNISVNSAKILQSITITDNTNDNVTSLSVLALSGVLTASLPIDLTSFKGRYVDNMKCVVLNWEAYNTIGTVKFEIERSLDGNRFTKIEEVMPFSANERRSYSYNDYTAKNTQTNFYRVKQIQQTGESVYTSVIRVDGTKASTLSLKLMQSPGAVHVQNILSQHSYDYTLMNSASIVIKRGKISSGDQSIDISSLSGGVYYLKLVSGNEMQTLKFFK